MEFEITRDQAQAVLMLQGQRGKIMEELVRANRAIVSIVKAFSPSDDPVENFALFQRDGRWIIQIKAEESS